MSVSTEVENLQEEGLKISIRQWKFRCVTPATDLLTKKSQGDRLNVLVVQRDQGAWLPPHDLLLERAGTGSVNRAFSSMELRHPGTGTHTRSGCCRKCYQDLQMSEWTITPPASIGRQTSI